GDVASARRRGPGRAGPAPGGESAFGGGGQTLGRGAGGRIHMVADRAARGGLRPPLAPTASERRILAGMRRSVVSGPGHGPFSPLFRSAAPTYRDCVTK